MTAGFPLLCQLEVGPPAPPAPRSAAKRLARSPVCLASPPIMVCVTILEALLQENFLSRAKDGLFVRSAIQR